VDDVELPFARAAAEHLALPLTVLDADRHAAWHVDPADPGLAAPLDEPMLADWRDALGSAAAHATVALYGEDGDALLRAPGWRGLRYGASIASIGMAAAWYVISERRRPYVGLRWRERMGIVRPRGERLPDWLTAEAGAILQRPSQRTILGRAPQHLEPHPARPEAQAILTSTTISRNFAATIAPETTRQSIELRFPIMDSRLIRLVISIPAIPWCQHKTLVRRAYRGRLPPAVLTRPKTPLTGFNDEYVAEWRRTTDPRAIATGSPMEGWIDTGRWMSALRAGAPGAAMAAWRVTALDAWLAVWARGSKDPACTR
jgi:hypothetical protein